MTGYCGSAHQQRLQASADAAIGWSQSTPGACSAGRALATDDPDRLGWNVILDRLKTDGAFGFRLLRADRVDAARERLSRDGYRLDLWDVFTADEAAARAASDRVLARGLPEGYATLDPARLAEDDMIARLQAFMLDSGVVPFSAPMLRGAFGPVVTVAILDKVGDIAAVAHAYLPHNRFSPYHRFAWGGLVAVAPSCRGRGLGATVNAMMVRGAFERLGATLIYELVSAGNVPSRRMVEACGLRLNPDYVSGAVSGTSAPLTR